MPPPSLAYKNKNHDDVTEGSRGEPTQASIREREGGEKPYKVQGNKGGWCFVGPPNRVTRHRPVEIDSRVNRGLLIVIYTL
jgi:hypothetical protein